MPIVRKCVITEQKGMIWAIITLLLGTTRYKMGILFIYDMSVMLWEVTQFCTYYNNVKLTH